jgi:hypothetical protein
MVNLFQERLQQLLVDHADLCERGDLSANETREMLLLGLLRELAAGTISLGIDEERFVATCRTGYQIVSEHCEKKSRRRKAK